MKRVKGDSAADAEKVPNQAAPGVREVQEARALLEKQLHRAYWWVFSACRIKGFIRAKELNALEPGDCGPLASSSASDGSVAAGANSDAARES